MIQNNYIERLFKFYAGVVDEHFICPCKINNRNYMPPQDLGYSIEMKENSVNEFSYPNGEYWKKN